jgi:hypothetical protein
LPFTIKQRIAATDLAAHQREAAAHTIATNVNFVSRPQKDLRFSARFRRYDYNNETPETPIPQFINYDTSVATSTTGGPELFAHDRNTFDADATWTGLGPLALTVGYTNNHNGYDFRIFQSTNEHLLQLKADVIGSQWMTFRAHYEYGTAADPGSMKRRWNRSASSRSCVTTTSRIARAIVSSVRWTSSRLRRSHSV